MTQKILIIDDDAAVREALTLTLSDLSCDVAAESDGGRGLLRALEGEFDVVVIDVSLPTMNGYDICRKLREKKPFLPILMLTSRSSEVDVVLGLELGADDYLTKPFRHMEMIARVRALLRRSDARKELLTQTEGGARSGELRFPGLTINLLSRLITIDSEVVELTALEFDLLAYLAARPGRTVTRDQLVEDVWGGAMEDIDSTMNTIFSRLRRKLKNVPGEAIATVRGVGYRFTLEPEKS